MTNQSNIYLVQLSDLISHRLNPNIDIEDLTDMLQWLLNELRYLNNMVSNRLQLTSNQTDVSNVIDEVYTTKQFSPMCRMLLEIYVIMFMEEIYTFLTKQLKTKIEPSISLDLFIIGDAVVVSILE